MEIALIRHGITNGNLYKKYIGTTDEPLCAQGERLLRQQAGGYPRVERVYTSPLLRARQTAGLLYPGLRPRVVAGLRECDFGEFEGKDCRELEGSPAYRAWVGSGGSLPFPGGESPAAFRARCCEAFACVIARCRELGLGAVALVVHGGTVMAVMERFAREKRDFYGWQVENGGGYRLVLQGALGAGARPLEVRGPLPAGAGKRGEG